MFGYISYKNYNMLTIEKIKTDFSYIQSLIGNSESYHDSPIFNGYGDFCDLYFKAKDKKIKQEQIDTYNKFKETFRDFIPEIEKYILSSLKNSEISIKEEIRKKELLLDVIQVTFDNSKYDLVLVCGKTLKRFFFFTKNIDIRVEFKNGRIKTIQRKKDTTEDND